MSFPGRFRVWDADMKKFYKGADIIQDPDDPKKLIVAPFEFSQISWSTGLFDKNGKEIFEGDILQTDGMDGKLLWVIKYVFGQGGDFGSFSPETLNHEFSSAHNEVMENGILIGNLYENPEILK